MKILKHLLLCLGFVAFLTGPMPAGAIVVKENYMPDKKLAAITVMYKVAGYNPEVGNLVLGEVYSRRESRGGGKVRHGRHVHRLPREGQGERFPVHGCPEVSPHRVEGELNSPFDSQRPTGRSDGRHGQTDGETGRFVRTSGQWRSNSSSLGLRRELAVAGVSPPPRLTALPGAHHAVA